MKSKIAFITWMFVFILFNQARAHKNNQLIMCDKPYEGDKIPCVSNISSIQYLEESEEYDHYTGDLVEGVYKKTLYFYLVSTSLITAPNATFVLREIISGEDSFNLEIDRKRGNVKEKGFNMVYVSWVFEKEGNYWIDAYSGDDFIGTVNVVIKMP